MKKVFLKNLGCPKNEIDGDILLSLLISKGFIAVENPEQADIIIVNSCGFINEAKEESIETLLSYAVLKEQKDIKLVLAGCLAQRYRNIIEKEMPEIDLIVGINDLLKACTRITDLQKSDHSDFKYTTKYREYPLYSQTNKYPYAYLKIADGCNNFCSYCAIPLIRGRLRSRRIKNIISEAQMLADNGNKELILVAQDITQYGYDLYGRRCLVDLLRKLEKIKNLNWIRLLYTHPAHYNNNLIDFLSNADKIVPYLDIPLQHISDRILKSMNRKTTAKKIKCLIDKLRDKVESLVIRTTYIIGFPGETEINFNELWQFQNDYRIERAGVFAYSREEDTKAYKIKHSVREEVVLNRIDRLMTLIMDQSLEYNRNLLGKNVEVLIDEKIKDSYYIGRRYDQAPEIDGYTKVKGRFVPGRFYNVKITGFEAYDLEAERWKG